MHSVNVKTFTDILFDKNFIEKMHLRSVLSFKFVVFGFQVYFLTQLLFLKNVVVSAKDSNSMESDNILYRMRYSFWACQGSLEWLSFLFSVHSADGSHREEVGKYLNHGINQDELVVTGTYTYFDEKHNTKLNAIYISDKNGYRVKFEIQQIGSPIQRLSPGALKSAAG